MELVRIDRAEWKQDRYAVKLEKNEDYQPAEGKSSGLAGAKNAQADTITFNIVTDTATRIAGVQNGQYDIAEDIPADRYERSCSRQESDYGCS